MTRGNRAEAVVTSPTAGQPQENSGGKPGVTGAMALMVGAMMFIPLMDVFAKLLSTYHAISPVMITWVRFVGQALLMLPVIAFTIGLENISSKHNRMNIVRGVLVGAAVSNFFIAIKYLPLADAIAIFFVEPLIVMLLSVIFLNEKIGWRRVAAAIVGFGGALLIIQPTYALFGAKALLPLLTASLFAVYLILSRKIGSTDHPYVMQFWSGIGGVAICTLFIILGSTAGLEDFAFTLPQSKLATAYLAIVIVIATFGHLLIVVAFSRAEASILAPFQYLEIVTMTIAGYLVFGDFPSLVKWLGIAIIVSSGLYIFLRERKVDKEPPVAL
jgi:drug/metabolite transporter (DMT)-like permease